MCVTAPCVIVMSSRKLSSDIRNLVNSSDTMTPRWKGRKDGKGEREGERENVQYMNVLLFVSSKSIPKV